MKYFVIVSTLFVSGSVLGWIIELFFRRFVSQKKWVNPGFLTGPYLPIYGFGISILYAISNIPLTTGINFLDVIIKISIIGVGMTLIEFIAGLIFIKIFKVKLWDYSNQKGNVMGIICPLFSLIWVLVGSCYYFFVNKFFVHAITWISDNLIYTSFIGLIVGMMIVDFSYSIHLATKLKYYKELQDARFEEFKKFIKKKVQSIGEHLTND